MTDSRIARESLTVITEASASDVASRLARESLTVITAASASDVSSRLARVSLSVVVLIESALAGTTAGSATVTATLTNQINAVQLEGTLAGVGSVTGTLSQVHQLAATTAGSATVTAALTAISINDLASTPTGGSTVSAALTQVHELSAAATGLSSVAALLQRSQDLASTVAGAATVTAVLSVNAARELAGTIAGTATLTADLANIGGTVGFPIPYPFIGSGASTNELVGMGIVQGESAVTATLDVVKELTGTSSGKGGFVYQDFVEAQGPRHHWRFDEAQMASGGTIYDSVGSADLVAGASGSVPTMGQTSPPAIGWGTAFRVSASYLQRIYTTTDHWTDSEFVSFSISMWAYIDAFNLNDQPANAVLSWGGNGSDGVFIKINKADYLWRAVVGTVEIAGPAMVEDTWYHLALTRDDDTGQAVFYVDGVPYTGGTSLVTLAPDELTVGTWDSGFAQPKPTPTGVYDELVMYDFVLSPEQVLTHYKGGAGILDILVGAELSGSASGSSTVTGLVDVGALDGDGDIIIELAGTIAGSSSVYTQWSWLTQPRPYADPTTWVVGDTPNPSSFLYLYSSVQSGFDPTDDASSHPDFVSQSYPDGNVRDDFSRVLYLYSSVDAAFDDIDDASSHPDFVSQSYPDGNLRDDFSRHLYLYANVIRGVPGGEGQLIIRPGWSPKTNPAIPPAGKHS